MAHHLQVGGRIRMLDGGAGSDRRPTAHHVRHAGDRLPLRPLRPGSGARPGRPGAGEDPAAAEEPLAAPAVPAPTRLGLAGLGEALPVSGNAWPAWGLSLLGALLAGEVFVLARLARARR